jgi:O-antigen/teichoic acid export membrane protein
MAEDTSAHRRDRLRTVARWVHPRAPSGQIVGLTAAQLLGGLLSAVWLLVVARHLSREAFGELTLMVALAGIFLVFSDLGLPMALGIHVAKRQVLDPKALSLVIRRRILLSVLVSIVAGAFYLVANNGESPLVPVIFVGYFVGTAIYTTQTTALRSIDRTHIESVNIFLSRLGILVLGLIWLGLGGKLLAASGIYSIGAIASAIAVTLVCRRHLRSDSVPVPVDELKVRKSLAFALATVTATIYASVDIWLLALLKGTSISGGYAAADRVLDAALIPAAAISILAQNRYPRYPTEQRKRFAFQLAGLGLLSTALPVIIGIAFAGSIMAVLFGESFRSDSTVLILLLCSAPAAGANASISLPVALASRRNFAWFVGAGLLLNVAANLLLIPHWGGEGSAVANLVSDLALLALLGVGLSRIHLQEAND